MKNLSVAVLLSFALCAASQAADYPALQGSGYTPVEQEANSLNDKERSRLAERRKVSKAVNVVAFDRAAFVSNPETISVVMPSGQTLVFKRVIADDVSWGGITDSGTSIAVGFGSGALSGSIRDGADVYVINGLNKRLQMMSLTVPRAFGDDTPMPRKGEAK